MAYQAASRIEAPAAKFRGKRSIKYFTPHHATHHNVTGHHDKAASNLRSAGHKFEDGAQLLLTLGADEQRNNARNSNAQCRTPADMQNSAERALHRD